MDKKAEDDKLIIPILPFFNDVYKDPFKRSIMAGVIGGAGISAAANLLRQYMDRKNARKKETGDDTIVLNLPPKAAESAYDSMRRAKSGETKITANGGRQFREGGRYAKGTRTETETPAAVKCALGPAIPWSSDSAEQGPTSVATMVYNTLGLAAGGLVSYDLVTRLFDRLNERRLKRKLDAAQQAYVTALSGQSKRAEHISRIFAPVEHVFCRDGVEKAAETRLGYAFDKLIDMLPQGAVNTARLPVAAYILGLLASTGASAYVTKKVMDREFPEEKLKKDINRPTRIVFRTVGDKPSLLEGEPGQEKTASDETCAALAAVLPIYADVVEGVPNRTLEEPYVKLAEFLGTDAPGLMKMAKVDFIKLFMQILRNPRVLFDLLSKSRFGLDLSKRRAADILKVYHPRVYSDLLNTAISDEYSGPGFANWAKRTGAQAINNAGGGDWLVQHRMKGSSKWDMAADAARIGYGKAKSWLGHALNAPGDWFARAFSDKPGAPDAPPSDGTASVKSGAATLDPVDWGTAKLGLRGALFGAMGGYALTDQDDQTRKLRNMAIGAGTGAVAFPAIVRVIQYLNEKRRSVKTGEDDTSGTLLHSNYLGDVVFGRKEEDKEDATVNEKDVVAKVRKILKGRRRITVSAADPAAAAYMKANKVAIGRLLTRLNARGAI